MEYGSEPMTQGTWKKGTVIESGNFPKNNFVGTLKAIYPTFNENLQAMVLQLDFEEGQTYNLPLNAKDYGLHEDGTVDGFLPIGKFCNSLEKIDVATGEVNMNNNDPNIVRLAIAWGFLDGEPSGFKAFPSNQDPETAENILIGCKLHNVATPREVGDAEQTAKAAKWPDWTIKKIEGLQDKKIAPPAAGKKPAATNKPAPKPAVSTPPTESEDKLSPDLVLAAIEHAAKEGKKLGLTDIFKALPSKADKTRYKVAEIRKCITEDLEGAVVLNGEKYEVA